MLLEGVMSGSYTVFSMEWKLGRVWKCPLWKCLDHETVLITSAVVVLIVLEKQEAGEKEETPIDLQSGWPITATWAMLGRPRGSDTYLQGKDRVLGPAFLFTRVCRSAGSSRKLVTRGCRQRGHYLCCFGSFLQKLVKLWKKVFMGHLKSKTAYNCCDYEQIDTTFQKFGVGF